jgi:hypothetical protein
MLKYWLCQDDIIHYGKPTAILKNTLPHTCSNLLILITESVKQLVKDNNGLYTESKMVEFQQEALLLLDNYSNSDFKEALILMVNLLKEK